MDRRDLRGLSGQWIGKSHGEYEARIVLDLDPIEGKASGVAYFFPDDPGYPCAFASVSFEDSLIEGVVESAVTYFNPANGYIPTIEQLHEVFPDIKLSHVVLLSVDPSGENTLNFRWSTESGFWGQGALRRMALAARSSLQAEPNVTDWQSFQTYVMGNSLDGFIYRGQSSPWPLQTSFHRTSRKDLRRYWFEDVAELHRRLTVELGTFSTCRSRKKMAHS